MKIDLPANSMTNNNQYESVRITTNDEGDQINLEDYWSLIIISGIVGLWLAQNAWSITKSWWKKSFFVKNQTCREKIRAILHRILDLVECDRVIILVPRKRKRKKQNKRVLINKENRDPLDSWTVSIEYEVLKSGVASAKDSFQNVNLSHLTKLIALAEQEKIVYRYDVDAEVRDPILRKYALENGIKSSITILMGDYQDPDVGCIGVIAMHFLNPQVEKIKEFDSSLIMKHIHELEGLLLSTPC